MRPIVIRLIKLEQRFGIDWCEACNPHCRVAMWGGDDAEPPDACSRCGRSFKVKLHLGDVSVSEL